MTAAADNPDPPEVSAEIARLMQTVESYRVDNLRLAARVAELERNPIVSVGFADDLRPLKSLLPVHVPYEVARRACESGALAASMPEHRWLSTEAAVAEWLTRTGRSR